MKNNGKTLRVLAMSLVAAFLMTSCCNETENTAKIDNGKIALETIMTRTSIRSFTERPVSADTIELLLRAGMAAPTAVNKQPWHFAVVTDRAVMDSLGGNGRQSQMWKQSPLAIAGCGDMEKALEGPAKDFWIQDCSAATENIL